VLEGDSAVRSCQTSARAAAGKSFTTIEGLSKDGSHPCQRAWIEEDVSQCGYCQPGMILELCALLRTAKSPSDAEIDRALSDHVCRCGSYPRIRTAARLAVKLGGAR
jgi:aerobic-type carbon monoxide dehydrogenase small subunit (CoxS/CutS family)